MEVLTETLQYEDLTVAELVYAAREGDRCAQGELVRRFEPYVLGTELRRLGNYAEAQELCQEVFVRALEKLDQLHSPEAFGGWLRSITVRMSINWTVRRPPAFGTEPEILEGTCAQGETPLEQVLAKERGEQVRAGLKRLGTMDRETLVAFYVEGQSLLEMSDAFRSPVGTIKRRLHVARKRLAKELEAMVAVSC